MPPSLPAPPLAILLGALSLPACGQPPEAPAAAFGPLHSRAFEVYALPGGIPDRDALYDLLARVFTGPELSRQYIARWQSLHRLQSAGSRVEVEAVEHDRVEIIQARPGEVTLEAVYRVKAKIRHQGHVHPRTLRQRARFTLVPTPDGWRIAGMELLELEDLP